MRKSKAKTFKFELGDQVLITCSGETGTVIGRAQYLDSFDNFYVRYKSGIGVACQQWWDGRALEAKPAEETADVLPMLTEVPADAGEAA